MDRNLRAFLAVARAGNLSQAAERIGLTQPALTKTIRRIEQEFGAVLFERTTRGMVLTEVGQMLLARAETIEMHYRQAHEEVRAVTDGAVARFRVAAGAAYHMRIAPDLVKRLSAEFPETRFVLDFDVAGVTLPKLVAGDVDLMLGAFFNLPPEGIETREILEIETTAYCAHDDPIAARATVPPQALSARKWIIYKRDALMAQRLEDYFAEHLLPPPRVVMEVDALAAILRLVAGSDFLTLAPTSLEGLAASAGLTRLRLQYPIWNFISGAWFRKSWRNYPIMRRALEILPELVAAAQGAAIP